MFGVLSGVLFGCFRSAVDDVIQRPPPPPQSKSGNSHLPKQSGSSNTLSSSVSGSAKKAIVEGYTQLKVPNSISVRSDSFGQFQAIRESDPNESESRVQEISDCILGSQNNSFNVSDSVKSVVNPSAQVSVKVGERAGIIMRTPIASMKGEPLESISLKRASEEIAEDLAEIDLKITAKGFTPKDELSMKKALRVVLASKKINKEGFAVRVRVCDANQSEFIVSKLKGLGIEVVSVGLEIGRGGYGVVHKLELDDGTTLAMKIPIPGASPESVLEEATTLNEVHSEGDVEGVQSKHQGLVYFIDAKGALVPHGFIGRYYPDGNLSEKISTCWVSNGNMTVGEAVALMQRLNRANEALQGRTFFNTDLKAENMFGLNGKFDLCDLGGLNTLIKDREGNAGMHLIATRMYTPASCKNKIKDLDRKLTGFERQFAPGRMAEEMQKIVISQTGVIAYQVFYGVTSHSYGVPYDLNQRHEPDYTTLDVPSNPKVVPEEIREFIKKMINVDDLDHPKSLSEVTNSWDSFAVKYP